MAGLSRTLKEWCGNGAKNVGSNALPRPTLSRVRSNASTIPLKCLPDFTAFQMKYFSKIAAAIPEPPNVCQELLRPCRVLEKSNF